MKNKSSEFDMDKLCKRWDKIMRKQQRYFNTLNPKYSLTDDEVSFMKFFLDLCSKRSK